MLDEKGISELPLSARLARPSIAISEIERNWQLNWTDRGVMISAKQRNPFIQYGVALLLVSAALGLSLLMFPYTDRASTTFFLVAIMLSAFFGGLGPGMLATFISAFCIDYFFIAPFYRFELNLSTLLRVGTFTTFSSLVSWLNATRRRLMVNLRERDQERERLLAQINRFNEHLRHEIHEKTQELNAATLELLSAQQKLAQAEKMEVVGQLAGSLAHEIGTPLNAISGHLQLLSRNHPNHPDTQRRVRIINKQLEFIVGIVRSLLERTHKRPAVIRPIDITRVLRDLIALVAPMLEQRLVNVELRFGEDLPMIAADRDKLHQVFLNLINNSLDAMPLGGKLSIRADKPTDSNEVSIEFQDSGEGIDPENFEQIFEPMWTDKSSGSGFGLAIAREIVREHGGEIEPLAISGGGASFLLTFPAIAAEQLLTGREALLVAD